MDSYPSHGFVEVGEETRNNGNYNLLKSRCASVDDMTKVRPYPVSYTLCQEVVEGERMHTRYGNLIAHLLARAYVRWMYTSYAEPIGTLLFLSPVQALFSSLSSVFGISYLTLLHMLTVE